MPKRVLVTRPEPGASETARRVEALGFVPVLTPLSQTRTLHVDAAAVPENFGAVAVSSANALRHAPPDLLAALAEKPCYAVGGRTAQAARLAGFADVIEGPGDATGLAELIVARNGEASDLVYLCGRVRLPGFEARLAAAGLNTIAVETYDMLRTEPSFDFPQPVDFALLHSALGAKALMEIAGRPQTAHLFADTIFLCLSKRIASIIEAGKGRKIRIAAEPTEEALLFLLARQG
jgi:uroporphyrinogen-III synthase